MLLARGKSKSGHGNNGMESGAFNSLPQDRDSQEQENDEIADERSEAELLAEHIRHIINLSPIQVREGGETRNARYGDVFVLARNRTGFDALATAFRRGMNFRFLFPSTIQRATAFLAAIF